MNTPAAPIDPTRQATTEPPREPPRHPPLRLRSTIDAAVLERVRVGLEAALFARMYGARSTAEVPPEAPDAAAGTKAQSKILVFLRRCSLLGLMVALAFTASGGLDWDGYRLDLILASYFIAALALSLLLPRMAQAARAWRPERWTWPRRTLARRLATRALDRSRAMAPFDAQYDIDDAVVTYTRIKGDDAKVEWTRPLRGWHIQGDGFTVLFEDTTSLKSVVILHAPSAHFDELLAQHGVLPLPPA